jgi:hypothetical protein
MHNRHSVKNCSAFYGTQRSITTFTRARHCPYTERNYQVHTLLPYSSQIHLNIVPQSIVILCLPRSSPFRFSEYNFVWIFRLFRTCYMSFPSHLPWLDQSTNIRWRVQIMNPWLIHAFFQRPVTISSLHKNILATCSQRSSFCVLPYTCETKIHTHTAKTLSVEWVTFLPCLHEIPRSNVAPEAGSSDRGFSWFSSTNQAIARKVAEITPRPLLRPFQFNIH